MLESQHPRAALLVLLSACALACGDDADASSAAGAPEPGMQEAAAAAEQDDQDEADGCDSSLLEPDFAPSPLDGPGIDADGELPPGEYILSSTYLRLEPGADAMARFSEVVGPAIADASKREGMLGMALAISTECGTARTLSVWRDEASMYEFVAGPAHAAAMASIGEISRGGSIAMHWLGTATDATWEEAAKQVGAFDGRTH